MVKTQGFLVPLSICQNYFLVLALRKLFESLFIRSTVKTVNPYLSRLNVIVRATGATSRLELSCWRHLVKFQQTFQKSYRFLVPLAKSTTDVKSLHSQY